MRASTRIAINLASCALVTILYLAIRPLLPHATDTPYLAPYLSLGLLINVAVLLGRTAQLLNLPALTGYLVAGMLCGPHVSGLVPAVDIQALHLINALATSFIALAAGAEIKFSRVRPMLRTVLSITGLHCTIIVGGVALCTPLLQLLMGPELRTTLPPIAAGLLLGILALANSPASILGIIKECRASGPVSDIVLTVTMLKDAIVVLLFSAIVALFVPEAGTQAGFAAAFGRTCLHLLVSCGAGVVMALLIYLFFRFVGRNISLFIILMAYFAHTVANIVGLEYMLTCMVAGCIVQNATRRGRMLIDSLDGSHLPVYAVFFAVAGAGLDFGFLFTIAAAAGCYILLRLLLVWLATHLGARLSGAPAPVTRTAWTGFIANAGLSLSLVVLLQQDLPGSGDMIAVLVLAAIAANQLLGPILFRIALIRGGETTR